MVFLSEAHSLKINLFADDIILSITSPIKSLPYAQEVLQSFGDISYYKVKCAKSVILPLNLPSSVRAYLEGSFPYSWSKKSISYLGLQLTADPSDLADANYSLLLDKLSKKTSRLAKIELSWSGPLASFKMLLLPQISYIFCTLPIPIKPSHLKALNSILRQYVWSAHRSRCSKALLTKHRSVGGMGFPEVRDYHRAFLLS